MINYKIKTNLKVPIEFVFNYFATPRNFEKISSVCISNGKYKFLESAYFNHPKLEEGMQFKVEFKGKNMTLLLNCITEEVIENEKVAYRYVVLDLESESGYMKRILADEESKKDMLWSMNKRPIEMDWIFEKISSTETNLIQINRIKSVEGFFYKLVYWFELLWLHKKHKKDILLLKNHIENEYKNVNNFKKT